MSSRHWVYIESGETHVVEARAVACGLWHVLEMFVQLRYFSIHSTEYGPHLEAKTANKKVNFKTMFEAFSTLSGSRAATVQSPSGAAG